MILHVEVEVPTPFADSGLKVSAAVDPSFGPVGDVTHIRWSNENTLMVRVDLDDDALLARLNGPRGVF